MAAVADEELEAEDDTFDAETQVAFHRAALETRADAAGTAEVLGPVGTGLHTSEEGVDLHSLGQLAQVLVRTAIQYCGPRR